MQIISDLFGVVAEPVKCLLLNYCRFQEAIWLFLNDPSCFSEANFLSNFSSFVLLWFYYSKFALMDPDLIDIESARVGFV